MTPAEPGPITERIVPIWDVPIRLFHWLLVGLLGFSWWSGKHHDMDWHRLSGYCILTLLLFRLYWGVVGGRTARFTQFVRGPRAVLDYLKSLGGGVYRAAPGHSPIGGWSVILMLATLVTMVVAGLFSVDVDGLESGPLADYVSFDQGRFAAEVHGVVFNVLLGIVVLHIGAILFYKVRLGHDLVRPMVMGGRPAIPDERAEPLGMSWWKAGLGIFVAGAIAYAVARGFRL